MPPAHTWCTDNRLWCMPSICIDIYSYTSLNSDADQLKNVNKYWAQADVIIYSPSIESGINFDVPHFNRLFGLFSNMSSSQRGFLQMINRVRKIKNPKITILNEKIFIRIIRIFNSAT